MASAGGDTIRGNLTRAAKSLGDGVSVVASGSVKFGGRAAAIVWLGLLFALTVLLSLLVLSTLQIRDRIEAGDLTKKQSVQRVREINIELDQNKKDILLKENIMGELESIIEERRGIKEISYKELVLISYQLGISPEIAFDAQIISTDARQSGPDFENRQYLIERRQKLSAEFRASQYSIQDAELRLDQIKTRLSELKKISIQLNAEKDSFGDLASTLFVLEAVKLELLLDTPKEMLVLILSLFMGALGSTIYVTRAFLDSHMSGQPVGRVSWYVFRPLLGMVMALAAFVFLKAGQITISDAKATEESLNPFFVSFIGIVSGLLSTQAQEAIQKAGSSIFPKREEHSDRWAFRLKEHIAGMEDKLPQLIAFLRVTDEKFQSWISEKESVPEQYQTLIAAFLLRPIREIFTAEPPDPVRNAQ